MNMRFCNKANKNKFVLNGIIVMFIILMPIVNNANGFSYLFYNISLLGPLFYVSSFVIIVLMVTLLGRGGYKLLVVLLWACAILVLHHMLNYTPLSQIQYSIKYFMPIIIYYALKSIQERVNWYYVLNAVNVSIALYLIFIWLSMLQGYRSSMRGYYGYVHGVNDLNVMFLISLPIIVFTKSKVFKITYILTYLQTLSKGLVLAVPTFVISLVLLKKNNKRIRMVFVAIALLTSLILSIGVFKYYYLTVIKPFLIPVMNNESIGLWGLIIGHSELFFKVVTFGRSMFLMDLIDKMSHKGMLEYFIGSGLEKGTLLLNGKVGVEMDVVDAFNMWGISGMVIFIRFYYLKILKRLSAVGKFTMFPLIGYSIFGGHLVMNPIANLIFVIVLLLVENNVFSSEMYKKTARQKNLWVKFGKGNAPSL